MNPIVLVYPAGPYQVRTEICSTSGDPIRRIVGVSGESIALMEHQSDAAARLLAGSATLADACSDALQAMRCYAHTPVMQNSELRHAMKRLEGALRNIA